MAKYIPIRPLEPGVDLYDTTTFSAPGPSAAAAFVIANSAGLHGLAEYVTNYIPTSRSTKAQRMSQAVYRYFVDQDHVTQDPPGTWTFPIEIYVHDAKVGFGAECSTGGHRLSSWRGRAKTYKRVPITPGGFLCGDCYDRLSPSDRSDWTPTT